MNKNGFFVEIVQVKYAQLEKETFSHSLEFGISV